LSVSLKTQVQIYLDLSIIAQGLAYCSTFIPNNHHNIGKINIETTVIIKPITAYLIVFIAGFILSSFHPDRINNNPHHNIKTIDSIPDVKINKDIIVRTKSQKLIPSGNI